MALSIYLVNRDTLAYEELSTGDFSTPLPLSAIPGGPAVQRKLFIRNDDVSKTYDGITLKISTTIGGQVPVGSLFQVKLLSGDFQPTEPQWVARSEVNDESTLISPVNPANPTETLPAIEDTAYHPFWIRLELSRAVPYGEHSFSFSLTATEHNV